MHASLQYFRFRPVNQAEHSWHVCSTIGLGLGGALVRRLNSVAHVLLQQRWLAHVTVPLHTGHAW